MNIKIILKIIFLTIYLALNINAQPFYFYSVPQTSSDTTLTDIYRINLRNSINELYYRDIAGFYEFRIDPSQKWLYVITRNNLLIINPSNPLEHYEPLLNEINYGDILGAIFVPNKNIIIISYMNDQNSVSNIYDSRFNKIFSIDYTVTFDAILSKDGNEIMQYGIDSLGNRFIDIYSIDLDSVIISRAFTDIGPMTEDKLIEDGRDGSFLIGYNYPSHNFIDNHYIVYSPESNLTSKTISLPIGSKGHLTYDTKYVILEEIQADTSKEMNESRPGNVYVFSVETGSLLKEIKLPQEGQILIYNNSVDTMYYFVPETKQTTSINLTMLSSSSGLPVKLITSNNVNLNTGSLQYYDGGWKDAINNNDGTFSVNTNLKTVSLRMTYEGGTQTLSNVVVGSDTAIFRTVNTSVQLKDSHGNLIDHGTVQYYAGAWRDFGTTTNGIASKELLPSTYSFRMTYAYASNDKQQNISTDPNIIFQTVNAAVQLKNSSGRLIDQGTVQYYAGAWRDFGTTTNGIASKELLPSTYSFRMNYAYANNDKQQNIGTDPNVIFQTVNTTVQLKNSSGNLIDQGTVQYYAGAWRDFGTTTNGVANKELLPNNYSFRMNYAYASNDKQQNIGTDPNVIFQTVNAAIQLKNSTGSLMDQGTVQYYAGAWRDFGSTSNGVANLELLPNNYSFRMTYEYVSKDIAQNIGTSNVVNFSTVLCTISVKNSQGQPVDNADAKYYSGAWREIGLTSGGTVTKELLSANLSFRINYGTAQQDKTQDISANNIVLFSLP